MPNILQWPDRFPRRVLFLIFIGCCAGLVFALWLQYSKDVEPCPMCIIQRYAFTLTGILCGITAVFRRRSALTVGISLALLVSALGIFTAARQSWLQWFPPPGYSCGRDIYGIVNTFPVTEALAKIYTGHGDCSEIDWTFLGASLANWGFLIFAALILTFLLMLWHLWRRR